MEGEIDRQREGEREADGCIEFGKGIICYTYVVIQIKDRVKI